MTFDINGFNKVLPATAFILLATGVANGQGVRFQNITLTQARQQAKATEKFLFVDVYTTWCKPCKEMELNVFSDAAVSKLVNDNFIAVRIDADKDKSAQVHALKVNAYPTMIYYHPNGQALHRQEGALDAATFLLLTEGLIRFKDLEAAYKKNSDKADEVYQYLQVLAWINPGKADLLGYNYLKDLSPKKYEEPLNWKLIQKYVKPSQKGLFNKVLAQESLRIKYHGEFKTFLLTAAYSLQERAVELQKKAMLDQSTAYINQFASMLPNADSLQLAFQLDYALKLQTDDLVPLLQQYLKKYAGNSNEKSLEFAYNLVQEHYRKDVLEFATTIADKALSKQPSALGYVVKALAYERLNNYKVAYANLLLSYDYADADMLPLITEYEKKLSLLVASQFAEGVNTTNIKSHDGRFTLGAGSKRLMYGFPVPESTSHFIVNVNNKLASNAPHLEPKGVTHLMGEIKYSGNAATPIVSIQYNFENVTVHQMLTPVDKTGKEIQEGFAQYYQVTYTFTNHDAESKRIGLSLLFDTMIDDNDNCQIKAGTRPIHHETKFVGKNIPAALQFFQTRNDTSSFMGEAVITGMNATPPDQLLVGRWPIFYNFTWQLTAADVPYADSGFFIQWENRTLPAKGTTKFITYYGLPQHKSPRVKLLMKDEPFLSKKFTVYFKHDSDEPDLNAKMLVSSVADDSDIVIHGVMLNGYADVTGGRDFNFELSRRRIDAVAAILRARNIAYIPKPYGLDESQHNVYNKLYGNTWDRRVDVIVYYRKKIIQ